MTENDSPSPPPGQNGPRPPSVWTLLRYGPRVLLADTKPRWIDKVLPFWVRWPVLIAALVIGINWSSSGIGEQAAAMLQYAALVAMSLGATFWLWVGVANLVFALLWFIPFRDPDPSPPVWFANRAITFVNRHTGHGEALFVWLVISLAAVPDLRYQLPFFVAVVLLGISLINAVTYYTAADKGRFSTEALYWRRRPYIYLFTLLGLGLLARSSGPEKGKLLPLTIAIVAGMIPRFVRYHPRLRKLRGPHINVAHYLDALFGPLAVIAGLAVVVGFSWYQRQKYDEASAPATHETDDAICDREVGGPTGPVEASLFLVADTQLHELGGERFPGQTELADAFVPVAVRPVELDMLSAATFWRLGDVFKKMQLGVPGLGWAHLGDVGDLGCKNEIDRVETLFRDIGRLPVLAGLSPGNHDSSFTGNFFWNPFWPRACKQGRLNKPETNERLSKLVAENPRVVWDQTQPSFSFTERGGALVSVSPLGIVHDHDVPRGLIGVFVDTADGDAFDFGVAGLFGTFSDSQVSKLDVVIKKLQAREQAPYDDPVFVVFAHHPFKEMAWPSQNRLKKFIEALDQRGKRPERPAVLGLITAHTHYADSRNLCLVGPRGRRNLHEIVIGSTIDPPQQAAHLVVGPDQRRGTSLRLTTFPVVGRPGKTCGAIPDVPAVSCQTHVAKLRAEPACAPLFERTGERLGPDCKALERAMTTADRLAALRLSTTGFDPDKIKDDQKERARRLLRCVYRDPTLFTNSPDGSSKADDPLEGEGYADLLNKLRDKPDRLEELTCLSWAASAVQEHKAAGMQMADALRCAFDDESLPAAREMVSTLEVAPCR